MIEEIVRFKDGEFFYNDKVVYKFLKSLKQDEK